MKVRRATNPGSGCEPPSPREGVIHMAEQAQETYKCEKCGHTVKVEKGKPAPQCCGAPMKKA